MQFMDVMAPLAALHIIRHPMGVQRLLTPQHKAGAGESGYESCGYCSSSNTR